MVGFVLDDLAAAASASFAEAKDCEQAFPCGSGAETEDEKDEEQKAENAANDNAGNGAS